MRKKVLLPNDVPEVSKRLMEEAGLEVIVGSGREPDQMKADGKDVAAVLIGTQMFDDDTISAMPNLKVIARNGVGMIL
jgi:Phosphoglycerate dehydrogenase and related dehydrogenases